MAPSFDCFSSLLCNEDISFFDEIDDDSMEMSEQPLNHINDQIYYRNQNQNQLIADPIELLPPLLSDETLSHLISKQTQHLPAIDYVARLKNGDLDFAGRMEAIDWIEKVKDYFGFGPLCVYLSINYLDRFLSDYKVQKQNWTMQLLAVSCLLVAAKLEETLIPESIDLQVGSNKFLFQPKTIQRMELMIMNTLKWRMQAITPFSFIDYFLFKVNDDQVPSATSFCKSSQLMLKIQKGIEYIEFKPAEIAAAVAIVVIGETNTINTENAASSLIQLVEKEKILNCIKLIEDTKDDTTAAAKDTTTANANASVTVSSIPQSPSGVLQALCLSFKSDEATNPNANENAANINSPDGKRMKLN